MTVYDKIPYTSKPDRGRHIDRLASIAHLLGLKTKNINRARVLEIGCGSGKNILAMAELLPQAEFVGIDPYLGNSTNVPQNCKLIKISLEEYTSDTKFDYILAHGVFSWVSPETQELLLKKINELLNSDGAAVVSYNSYPGWYLRQSIRDLLLNFDDNTKDPKDRIKKAREVLKSILASVLHDYERPYSVLIHQELERIAKEQDAYLLHEFLSSESHAYYYKDFSKKALSNGLLAIGDARFSRMSMNRLFQGDIASASFKEIFKLGSELGSTEHIMDHLWFNVFRETILCHSECKVEQEVDPAKIRTLSFSGFLNYIPSESEFHDVRGVSLKVTHPLLIEALQILTDFYPSYLSYTKLLMLAQGKISDKNRDSSRDEELLTGALMEWMQRDIIDFSLYPPNVSDRVLAHPKTTPYIREQAKISNLIVNLCHNTVDIGALECEMVQMLDGTNDHEVLLGHALSLITKGEGGIKEDGVEITDAARQKELLNDLLAQTLETIRRAGLLLP